MNFHDIENYAKIGSILERAEKIRFEVTTIKIRVGADRTEEIRVKDLSDKFSKFLSNALKDEQKHIENSLFQTVNERLDWSNSAKIAETKREQTTKIICYKCNSKTEPADITTINGAMYCKGCTTTTNESNQDETKEHLIGDYTLFIGKEDRGRKTNFVEWGERNSGSDHKGIIKTYYVKYASNRFPEEYECFGMVREFTLRNNATGEKIKYRIGENPQTIREI